VRRHPDQPLTTPTPRRAELCQLVRLAVPIALTNLGGQVMSFVDTAMLGRYSDAALAGTGIANTVIFTVLVLGMGTVMGLDTLIPQALGAGESRRARRLFWVGIRLAVLIGLPVTLLTAATPWVFPLFGVESGASQEGTVYIYARLPGLVPLLFVTAQRMYLQATGTTRPLVVTIVICNVVNVALNYVLIFGFAPLGVPRLGSIGAALGTTIVSCLMAALLGLSIRKVRVTPSDEDSRPLARKTLRVGLPVGLQYVAEVGVFALAGLLAGRLGRLPLAGHYVALMLASLFFNIAFGLASAGAVRVGQAIGRDDHPGTRRAGTVALTASFFYALLSATLLVLLPEPLARILTDEAPVIAAAVPLIQIAAVFQLSDGAQAVAGGVLRGAGDTRAAFIGNVIGHYFVGLPLGIALAFGFGWGAPGLWWGLTFGLTAVAVALWLRFFWLSRTPIERA
jgi:MATE family multidrug resistance protein